MDQCIYTIEQHKHVFAAWAASRAASVPCQGFTVEAGRKLIELCGFSAETHDPALLPAPSEIDARHRDWRQRIKVEAVKAANRTLTDGIAAKLLNCYVKARFVCGGHHDHAHVAAFHPPIDSVLLEQLDRDNFGNDAPNWRAVRWTTLNSEQYQFLIETIREALRGAPMWSIEKFWRGYRR